MSGSCIKCGGPLGDFDVGGDMICQNCESRAHSGSHGGGTLVQCQRCGMYLPSHELQMWNSRLYCAYCIMDIKDEERYGKSKHAAAQEQSGGILGPQSPTGGTCERCGRHAAILYSVSGRRVCDICYATAGAPGGGFPTLFGTIAKSVLQAIGILKKEPPRIVVAQRQSAPQIVKQQPAEKVFDLLERRMVDRKEGVHAKHPLAEAKHGKKEERKPLAKVKKTFFWSGKRTTEETRGRSADEEK